MSQAVLGGKTIDEACADIFNAAYESTHRVIQFKPEWSNGAGSFDYAIYGEHAPKLEPGHVFKTATGSGRKMIFIGTKLGNVVVFEGRASSELPMGYFYQSTQAFIDGGWFHNVQLDDLDLEMMFGARSQPNIGQRINTLVVAARKTSERTAA